MCGNNMNKKLGLNTNKNIEYTPDIIKNLQDIKSVSCGSDHFAAIDNDGNIYTWGNGLYGQLGHGDKSSISIPKRVNR